MSIVERLRRAADPDRVLQATMSSLIEAAGFKYALNVNSERYQPGKPLKLLLAGYAGTRNTGADVRVEEMIRQLRTVFGDDHLQLSIFTIDPALSAGYFRTVRQVVLPPIFPKFLFDECPKHHGVVACEGSMFKSKFADALATMMAGSLGMASVEGKLSVGYGAEAGAMEPGLAAFVRKHCAESLIICRNEPSRAILEGMGVRTKGGTDTAWTFEPAPLEQGRALLRDAGWDGQTPVLAICPINPFWWPAKPDLLKAAAHRWGGQYRGEFYKSVYFHHWSQEAADKYGRYLDGLAEAVGAFARERRVFPILVGMEQLDRAACEDLARRLAVHAPLFVSDEHDMYRLVSVLRNCAMMVSSRYHAMVTSMPAGVPSAGVTMDERIHNLMHDRGHPDLLLRVDDADLGSRLLDVLRVLARDGERLGREIAAFVPGQLRLMGQMGIDLEEEARRVYPELPTRDVPRSWEHYLPPLSAPLRQLMEVHA